MQGQASTICGKNSQVSEQRARIEALINSLTDSIARLDQRLASCLRQEPQNPSNDCEKLQIQKVELAKWLMDTAQNLEARITAIDSITNRCEL